MRYAVRCCCQPRKVFGWLELPAGLRDGQRLPITPKRSWRDFDPYAPLEKVQIDTILIRRFSQAYGIGADGRFRWSSELAVYSEDRPEVFWRALPNFTPAADDPASYSTLHDDRDG